MTRINSGISVKKLTDEHLLAEHKEIARLPFYLKRSIKCGSIQNIPQEFCLGNGHVKFFLNKMAFILKRYKSIHKECLRRNFNVKNLSINWFDTPSKYNGDYTPTDKDKSILHQRIMCRIIESKKPYWHYYGQRITKEKAIKLLID